MLEFCIGLQTLLSLKVRNSFLQASSQSPPDLVAGGIKNSHGQAFQSATRNACCTVTNHTSCKWEEENEEETGKGTAHYITICLWLYMTICLCCLLNTDGNKPCLWAKWSCIATLAGHRWRESSPFVSSELKMSTLLSLASAPLRTWLQEACACLSNTMEPHGWMHKAGKALDWKAGWCEEVISNEVRWEEGRWTSGPVKGLEMN